MTAVVSPEASHEQRTHSSRGASWLFVKERFAWPRASGHDVHTYYMMKGLTELGQRVSVLSLTAPPTEALAGLPLHRRYFLDDFHLDYATFPVTLSKSQRKFADYWGIPETRIQQVGAAAADCQADVVVVSGLNVLPYLGAVTPAKRVWYAADEWVWHHLSMMKLTQPSTWKEAKPAAVKGLYERAYRSILDRVWVVSNADARAFRWLIGINRLDIIPNGVDAEHFAPGNEVVQPKSCVFWGRLDFGPNIQGLKWFCEKVWPRVRQSEPQAQLNVFGFQPSAEIENLCRQPGIRLTANLPDLRSAVRSCGVAVLPFVSGGGIKNKLLEAAAMGLPIVCSPRALHGLKGQPPLNIAKSPREWVEQLRKLWTDPVAFSQSSQAVRAWVTREHTWTATAQVACHGLSIPTGGNRQGQR